MKSYEGSWPGFPRPDGSMGIRNRALIVFTSGCAAPCARAIHRRFDSDRVDIAGCSGCLDNPDMDRKLRALALHPNVGAVLVAGCGREPVSAAALCQAVQDAGRPAAEVTFQESGSFQGAVDRGAALLETLLRRMECPPTAPMSLSDLVVGVECGGSDFTSGLAANPLVGRFADYMVDRGATILFEEMYECVGLKDYLVRRCATLGAARAMAASYDKYFDHSSADGQFYISPGNVRGGLTTIEEKSMGAIIKSGTRPIQGLVRPCQHPDRPGLWMMDAMGDDPAGCGFPVSNDASSTLLQLTCGAHMTLLTSGRGHLVNNPIGPTYKITGNPTTYARLSQDMDLDVSGLLDGCDTLSGLTRRLLEAVALTAAGRLTKGEALGHREAVLYYERVKGGCADG